MKEERAKVLRDRIRDGGTAQKAVALLLFALCGGVIFAGPVDDLHAGYNLDFDLRFAHYNYSSSVGFSGSGDVQDEEAPPRCIPKSPGSLNISINLHDLVPDLPERYITLVGQDLGGNRVQFYADQDGLDIWITVSGLRGRIDRVQIQLRAQVEFLPMFMDEICSDFYTVRLTPIDGDDGNFMNAWGIVRIGIFDFDARAQVRQIDYVAYGGIERIPPTIEIFESPTLERWYNENRPVRFRLSDNERGVRGFGRCWSVGSCDPPFETEGDEGSLDLLSAPGDGRWTACVRAWDNRDNTAFACLGWFGLDRQPPTAARISGAQPDQWYRGNPLVSWRVTDPGAPDSGSGVRGFQWRWSDGDFSNFYAGPEGAVILREGRRHLIVRTFDNTDNGRGDPGNTQDVDLGEFRLDNTPPTANPPTFSISSPCNAPSVQINLSGSDALSGIALLRALVDGNPIGSVPGESGSLIWNTLSYAEGVYTVRTEAQDAAGNITLSSPVSYRLDRTPPVTQASLSGTPGESGWYISAVQVTLSATDLSGIRETRYSVNGGVEQTYTQPFQISQDGIYTVRFYSLDATNPPSGNRELTKQANFRLDTTPPVTPIVLDSGDRTDDLTRLFFRFCSSDPTSGLKTFRYALTTDPNAPDDPLTWFEEPLPPNVSCYNYYAQANLQRGQTYYIRVRVKNEAGLWSLPGQSDGILIDPQANQYRLPSYAWGSVGMDYPADPVNNRPALQGTLGQEAVATLEGNINGRPGDLLGDEGDQLNDLYAGFWQTTILRRLSGDVNRDDVVDDLDLQAVLTVFGSADPPADLNGDGLVDNADLEMVLENFGSTGDG